MFILFGRNMGPPALRLVNTFPLPADLAGTSIRVTVGGTTVNAIMIYTSFGQVAAILPSATPVGSGTLTLTFNNQTSAAVAFRVGPNRIGIFTRNSAGNGPGIVQNFNSPTELPLNTLVEAAQPDQAMILWATGLGPVSGNEAAGPLPAAQPSGVTVEVFVGGKAADVIGFGRSGCCAGIDQIAFRVPAGVEGCYVPVAVRAGGVVSNFTTIAVASSGKICSDPTKFSIADLQKVQFPGTLTVAEIALARLSPKLSLPGLGTLQGNLDFGDGAFRRFNSLGLLGSNRGSLSLSGPAQVPSLGGCSVSAYRYQDLFDSIGADVDDPVPLRGLDAGAALNFTGPRGVKQITRHGESGRFEYHFDDDLLGGGIPGLEPVQPDYLVPGSYTLDNGSGGAEVGAFRATLTIPGDPPVWTNQDAISNISRSQDLTVTWSRGAAGGFVGIIGSAADPRTGAGAAFTCTARADAGSFTVPAWVLSALPASGPSQEGVPVGFLSLAATLPQPSRFQATGIDVGFFNWVALQIKNVTFQ